MSAFAVFHIEWCREGTTGRDVILSCLKALGDRVVPDGVHPYHPEYLTYVNDGLCEDEVWFSVQLADDSTLAFHDAVAAIRGKGWRVKTAAGDLPVALARADGRAMLDWLYDDDATSVEFPEAVSP